MEIRRAAEHRSMPWANGLGTTLELAVHPAGSTPASMDWRISVATISEPGPFSPLPGVDRILTVIDDITVTLSIDGRDSTLRRFDQVAFSGDSAVSLTSVSAPGRDLNLMTRRGAWRGSVEVLDLATGVIGEGGDAWLLTLHGSAVATLNNESEQLHELDLLRLVPRLCVTGSGAAALIRVPPSEPRSGAFGGPTELIDPT